MVSLNDGDVVELEFTRVPGGSLNNAVTSAVTAKSDPFSARNGSTGGEQGGTAAAARACPNPSAKVAVLAFAGSDVTLGADGHLYRITARVSCFSTQLRCL
jgi:hypothetical protein